MDFFFRGGDLPLFILLLFPITNHSITPSNNWGIIIWELIVHNSLKILIYSKGTDQGKTN